MISEDSLLREKLLMRLRSRSTQEGECLIWDGCRDVKGYGNMRVGIFTGKIHRVAWACLVGPPPVDRDLDHKCRRRSCWNVEHLRPATTWENVHADGSQATAAINAAKDRCPRGHEYTPENTRWQRSKGRYLGRACRACDNQRHRDEYAQWRAENPKQLHPNTAKTHCKMGHEFNAENTYQQTVNGRLRRVCRVCKNRAAMSNYRRRQIKNLERKLARFKAE